MQVVTFGRRPQQGKPPVDIDTEVDTRLAAYEPISFPSFAEAKLAKDGAAQTPNATQQQQRSVRVKTSHVLTFMCLQIGNDPPDYVRIEPCAKLECWTDPSVAQARFISRGSEGVAEALEQQYRLLQKDAVYKRFVEVTIDEAKSQLSTTRRKARDGRILFHYNGHGMPRATHLGELWLFDKDRTHYMPMHINEVANTLESPVIYVFDCNSAGALLTHWQHQHDPNTEKRTRDFMICACSEGEFLPMNPLLPADMLTSCLTTPIKMIQEWYISYSHRKTLLPNVTDDMVRHIPGDLGDRKTPLGELHWIFTAVTDTIAWCTTPEQQFHSLFRQDVVVKSLFRNFLLAEKLLREVGCTPVTYPPLPDTTYSHYMWDTWEVAFESIVSQLPNMLNSDMSINTLYSYKPTTFFVDQLTAFEVWVEAGDPNELPEQLPCVILSLTQISQRVRALTLLSRYLATGSIAVTYAVRCGVLLYISKLLLQTPEVFLLVTIVWSQIVALDAASACAELGKHQGEKHFIRLLTIDESKVTLLKDAEFNAAPPTSSSEDAPVFYDVEGVQFNNCVAAACFILCKMLDHGGDRMYVSCWNQMIVKASLPLLSRRCSTLRSWGCLLLAKMFSGLRAAKELACNEYASRINLFSQLLHDKAPLVRSSCVALLATLLGTRVDTLDDAQQLRRIESDKTILIKLREKLFDHSSAVRQELVFGAAQVFYHYGALVEGCTNIDTLLHPPTTEWRLNEPGVNIKSALSASKPTDNILFDDTIQFNTTFLTKDDPPPPASWNRSRIAPRVLEVIEHLLHDASVILATLHRNADQRLVESAAGRIQANDRIMSYRLASETSKAALGGVTTNSDCVEAEGGSRHQHLSEEDRAKRSRNRDHARRLLLDMQGKKFEPPSAASAATPSAAQLTSPLQATPQQAPAFSGSGVGFAGIEAPPRPPFGQIHCISASHDPIVCGQFRLLEPQVIVAERNNRITIIDYESNQGTPHIVGDRFCHPGQSVIHDMVIVNDLSTDPGIVVLNKAGGFTVYRGIADTRVLPQQACTFSACANSGGTIDLKMAYRSDGHLMYAGPTNLHSDSAMHRNEISIVNLTEEQVVQRVAVVGDAPIHCMCIHPTSRCIFLGLGDGLVKYYDDRSKQGLVSAISNLQKKGISSAADAIVGLSVMDESVGGGASIGVMACTTNSIRLFDLRQPSQPTKIVDIVQSTAAALLPPSTVGKTLSSFSNTVAAPSNRAVTAFGGATYTGLCCAVISDNACDVFNPKCVSILPRPIKVKDAAASAGACFMHPMRPLAFFNGEIVSIF